MGQNWLEWKTLGIIAIWFNFFIWWFIITVTANRDWSEFLPQHPSSTKNSSFSKYSSSTLSTWLQNFFHIAGVITFMASGTGASSSFKVNFLVCTLTTPTRLDSAPDRKPKSGCFDKICVGDPASYSWAMIRRGPFPMEHWSLPLATCVCSIRCHFPNSLCRLLFQKAAWPSVQLAKTAVLGINAVNCFSDGLSIEIINTYLFSIWGVLFLWRHEGPPVFPSCLMLATVSWQAMPHALQHSSSVWITCSLFQSHELTNIVH